MSARGCESDDIDEAIFMANRVEAMKTAQMERL
jgi:hypothetical protein